MVNEGGLFLCGQKGCGGLRNCGIYGSPLSLKCRENKSFLFKSMEARAKRIARPGFVFSCLALLAIGLGLHLISLCNNLLFHTLAEFFSITVAGAIFIFAWNTRQIQEHHFFLLLGIAYLFVGMLDLAHTLSYKGMAIFPQIDSQDTSNQLWIAARCMEGASLLLAFLFLRRRLNACAALAAYLLATSIVLLIIFACHIFPECYSESTGLTAFKKNSEYAIILLLTGSLLLLQKYSGYFDSHVLRLMQVAILLTIAAELCFTRYVTPSDLANFLGHFFRIFSFYAIYRAVIETGLTRPYNMLFRELHAHREELESKVRERTAALQKNADSLQAEVAERRRAEEELLWELAVNRVMAQVSDALISRSFSIKETGELIAKAAQELTNCEAAETVLEGSAAGRQFSPDALHVPARLDSRMAGRIVLTGKTQGFNAHDRAAAERLAAVFALAVQRQQMEESLHKSESKYQSLFNDAPDMIHIVNRERKIVDVNPVELLTLGRSREEVVGAPLLNFVHPDFKDRTAEVLEQIFAAGSAVSSYETALISKDGAQIDVEVSAVPLLEKGETVSVRAIMRNITERKKAEQEKRRLTAQLLQMEKMKALGMLASGIAHDFNNILGPIIGYTDMTIEALPRNSDIADWMQEVRRAGMRAKELVRQVLAFSRKIEQELQPIRIQLIIKEVLKLLRSSLPSTIEIREHIDPACGLVLADSTRIHQVIMNLCTNAYHAMRESGGLLEVSLRQIELTAASMSERSRLSLGAWLRLEVRDTGCGMAADMLEKIFEPYFTTKAKGDGTGLGLALVQSIVLDFGGEVTVESEPGKGSVFQVHLPVVKSGEEKQREEEAAPPPAGRERVLVVDDDASVAGTNSSILSSLGYQVTVLHSSTQALALFSRQPEYFDLLLTDMTMPEMTGAELMRKILALRPDLPVLLCTGFSELIDERKAVDMGAHALLMKPFSKQELGRTVRAALDRRRGQRK